MDEKTTALCENVIANRDIIKKVFRGENIFIYPIASNALTSHGVIADVAKLKECKKIINKYDGALSYPKGNVMIPFACVLSMKEDPKAHFDKVTRFYSFTKKHFNRSEYSALLAIMLADYVEEDNIERVVKRGSDIYSIIKEQHSFLTNDKDSILSGLVALSEKGNTELIDDMEKCYDLLKIKYSQKSSIHSVSHVLALTKGTAHEKVDHFNELYDTLKESGKKFGVYSELSTLASVSILDEDFGKLRDTVLEIDAFLSKQKGYGLLGLDKKTRLMHAAMLTTDLYDTAHNAVTDTSDAAAVAMAAAQQIAICVLMTGSAASNI